MTFSYKTQQTPSQLNSICNLDEDDLNFDLDDNLNNNPTKRTLSSTSLQSATQGQPSVASQITHTFKRPKHNSVVTNRLENANQSQTNLFELDAQSQSTDSENNFGKSKENFASSTQIYEQGPSDSYSQYGPLETSKNESTIIDMYIDQQEVNSKIWSFARDHLIDLCQKLNVDRNILQRYSLKNYTIKFFKYNLLQKSNENKVCRIPFVYGYIKSILQKSTNATILLTDDTSEMVCSVSNSMLKQYADYVKIGTVLVLQDVCFMRVHFKKTSNHLNLNLDNLYSLYCLSSDANNDMHHEIQYISVRNINPNELREKIKIFENTFSLSELRSRHKANKASVSSNEAIVVPLVNRQPDINKTNPNKNQFSNKQPTSVPTATTTTTPAFKSMSSVSITTTNANLAKNTKNPPESVQKRNFVFKPTTQPTQTNSGANTTNTANTNNVSTSASQVYSEELLSQLIFGIEDEFLNDDD